MEQYFLDNDWRVWEKENEYFLEVSPIENSIFRNHVVINIPLEVFVAVRNGERRIKQLSKKFRLYELVLESGSKKATPQPPRKNTRYKYYGNGWFVQQRGKSFFISYQSGAQGGTALCREISEEVYRGVRSGKYKFEDIVRIYNL